VNGKKPRAARAGRATETDFAATHADEFAGQGGAYVIKNGKRELVHRTRPWHVGELERLQKLHKGGDRLVGRAALYCCAQFNVRMPPWLAQIVLEALRTSSAGKPDSLLGFGNERMLATWRAAHLQGRNKVIRQTYMAWPIIGPREKITHGQLVELLASGLNLSKKGIERVLWPPTSPTRKVKK